MPEELPWGKHLQDEAEQQLKDIEAEEKEVDEDVAEADRIAKLLEKL